MIVAADLIEHTAAKHCRAMGKGNISRTTHETPAIPRTHFPAAGVNTIAQRTNYNNILLALHDLPLSSKPIRMSNVVCIHASEYRRACRCDDGIRAAGESESLFAFVKMDSLVATGPLP